jgi:hypothetical protein
MIGAITLICLASSQTGGFGQLICYSAHGCIPPV